MADEVSVLQVNLIGVSQLQYKLIDEYNILIICS
jgi:hypothetical protein